MLRFIVLMTGIFGSHAVLAHAGHNHNAADAGLIHLSWLAPLIIAGAIAVVQLRKRFINKD